MKLLRSNESKINKDKNGENVSHLEITEVILFHCNLVNNDSYKIQEFHKNLFQTNHLVVY